MSPPSPGSHCFKRSCFAMNSELSSKIIYDIFHLKQMSAWHMFTQERADHFEFPQGQSPLISLLKSNLQHCEFCRWQPDETAVGLSPEGLDTPSQASPGPKDLYLGCSQSLICCPLNGMHSVTQPIYTLKLPEQRDGLPVLLLMALFPTQQRKMAKNIK